jgi:hypothetical protein
MRLDAQIAKDLKKPHPVDGAGSPSDPYDQPCHR